MHFYPKIAADLKNNFELLPKKLYENYINEMINIINGYRGGQFNVFSEDDKQLKYDLEYAHEKRMGRIGKKK